MPRKPEPRELVVRLRDDAPWESFWDPQTHLGVEREPRTVDAARVGAACRASEYVIIEEPATPAKEATDA